MPPTAPAGGSAPSPRPEKTWSDYAWLGDNRRAGAARHSGQQTTLYCRSHGPQRSIPEVPQGPGQDGPVVQYPVVVPPQGGPVVPRRPGGAADPGRCRREGDEPDSRPG